MRTILQVPMPTTLRNQAEAVSVDMGFSSLQEVVRLILTKFAKKEIGISIEQFPAVPLSARNEKRYLRMERDFKSGKNSKTFANVTDLMNDLIV
jgi:antitoxin component of RelBE/YafQ-DinJ toxin-antitoxin module